MSSAESDRPDTGNAATTADPQTDPERAVDEMEERTLHDSARPPNRVDEGTDDGTGSAFDVDLDPDDQGRHDAGAEQSG